MQYGIGLYRNNSISVRTGDYDDRDFVGSYYTPDYIIKHESSSSDVSQYFILDAKYSTKQNVLKHQVPELTFKYLFSITPIQDQDQIVGLYVINGQSDEFEDGSHNIYDKRIANSIIIPRAEVVTLTENSSDSEETHMRILNGSIGRFF